MFFEPNPVVFYAKAKIVDAGLRFPARSSVHVELWSGLDDPPPSLNLAIVRGFRENGDEFDPVFWTFGKATRGKAKAKGEAAPWCVDLVFRGDQLTRALDKGRRPRLSDFKAHRAAEGARSLYRAFARTERIQLYVVELNKKGKRIPGSLGGLLLDLKYR